MKAFICVYRHPTVSIRAWNATENVARDDRLLQKFLGKYKNTGCFYDWGDDPSFFCARERLRDVGAASWGVCRRDVRAQLVAGDFVVFFCAKQDLENSKIWDYYLIGCATVQHLISRNRLWTDSKFLKYRNFYNTLAKPIGEKLVQSETFYDYHDDWSKRAAAPYIIFNSDPRMTKINIDKPLHVARMDGSEPIEKWFSDSNDLVMAVEKLLFHGLDIKRRLRIKNLQHAHRHIALHEAANTQGLNAEKTLCELRGRLLRYI